MPPLADSLLSSTARPLAIRKRADLEARKQYYLGRTYWIVKEPLGQHYFRFQEEEYAILQMLDGRNSLDSIQEKFEAEFPPQKITLEELHQFLGMLHRSGLIVSSVGGQARELLKRRNERVRKEWLAALANILCFRFKGIDPERLLVWLHRYLGWFFSTTCAAICITMAVAALLLVAAEFNTFRSKLPEFHQFFTARNAIWMAICLGCTKVLHEFGHGLSCKHFGGECHELGAMILVLTPCLYCNVSDSWMLPNKWHRMFIGAAGMYVEMVLASIATFIWWFSAPGLLNNLALNVMFICSVSTLIFNGNPLLRYDGYYILADFLEIPNLRQKSTDILGRKAGEWCLGLEMPEDPFLPQRNQMAFALYAVASAIYRWVVMLSILLFLNQVWKPYKLEIIGNALGLMSLYGIFVYPSYRVFKFLKTPGRLDKVKKWRIYATIGVLTVLIGAFLFLPLPFYVMCSLEVQPREASPVYVERDGILEEVFVKRGDTVTKGQTLARLRSPDLELEINKLKGMCEQYSTQLNNLRKQRFRDTRADADIAQVEKLLTSFRDQLADKLKDQQRLTLKARIAGTVMPSPEIPRREDPDGRLPMWSGTPLEPENIGAHLDTTTLFCQIGQPKEMEATLLVDQVDLEFVREGQKVDVKLDSLPHDTLEGTIKEIASIDLKTLPRRLTSEAGGDLPVKRDPLTGEQKPTSTSYQARVPLDDPDNLLRLGLRGRGKVHADWQPLARRLWRFLVHTFNFRI